MLGTCCSGTHVRMYVVRSLPTLSCLCPPLVWCVLQSNQTSTLCTRLQILICEDLVVTLFRRGSPPDQRCCSSIETPPATMSSRKGSVSPVHVAVRKDTYPYYSPHSSPCQPASVCRVWQQHLASFTQSLPDTSFAVQTLRRPVPLPSRPTFHFLSN